jgi:hypothetical protein
VPLPARASTAPAGNWSLPSGCTLSMIDGYAWGYDCSTGAPGTVSDSGATVTVVGTSPANWAVPGGCTLGVTDGYVWGFSC